MAIETIARVYWEWMGSVVIVLPGGTAKTQGQLERPSMCYTCHFPRPNGFFLNAPPAIFDVPARRESAMQTDQEASELA